jgi:hypothetical protein
METEVWVRNPDLCIRECLEVGVKRIVWDRGYLLKRGIDAEKFMDVHYGVEPYEMMIIGTSDQGAFNLSTWPHADRGIAHPVWEYGEPIERLERLLAEPAAGHAPRVIVTQTPIGTTGIGRQFFLMLRDLQADYPESIVHVHGLYSYRFMFGLGFRGADIEPRELARKGKVTLPTGKEVTYERASEMPHWVSLLGMRPVDLKIPRNRCMYNIKSAQWSAKYFAESIALKHKGFEDIRPDDPFYQPPRARTIMVKKREALEGDKFICDVCSLQDTCRYFRQGAVCSVPDSDSVELAQFFKTRDSEAIIDGLGTLLAMQTRRLQAGLIEEAADGDIDPEVTKIINTLFDRGVKLAKLVNPALAAAGAPKITFNQNTLNTSTPQALMAAVVEEFVSRGIPREQITPEMVMSVLQPDDTKQRAIDVATVPRSA